MDISEEIKRLLLEEFEYAIKKMEDTEDPIRQLYYFSATFGVIHRIFNIEYHPELIFIHFILEKTHKAFTDRLNAIAANDRTVPVTPEHFSKVVNLTKDLANKIESNENFVDTLKEFIILAYSTSGNGFYLYDKGVLKI